MESLTAVSVKALPSVSVPAVQPVLLAGDRTVWQMAHRVMFRAQQEAGQVVALDAGGGFDPYTLARLAKQRGCDPLVTLREIGVMRAFTVYQLIEGLRVLLREVGPVFLLGSQNLFGDPDLAEDEAVYYHRRLTHAVATYRREGRPLFFAERAPARERPFLLGRLQRATGPCWEVQEHRARRVSWARQSPLFPR